MHRHAGLQAAELLKFRQDRGMNFLTAVTMICR